MRAVVFTGSGGNEVVRIEERADPAPQPDEVLVRARYAGLNPADLLQRAGRYPPPPGSPPDVPGLEVCGAVEVCGAGVTLWQPGDRVFGLVGGGGLADLAAVHESCVTRVPEVLEEREAAAVPEVFITAHDAIVTQAGLAPGETLLVHGASGGVGTAACQIGRELGALVIGVVRCLAPVPDTGARHQLSRSEGAAELVASLGADPVPDGTFVQAVREMTGGRGADVILELVGAPHFPGNLEALAPKGRIAVVGVGGGQEITLSLLSLMAKRASIRGTVLRSRSIEEKAAAIEAFGRDVVPALAAGRMRAVIDSVFPLERVTEAFDRLDGRGKAGKVLLDLE